MVSLIWCHNETIHNSVTLVLSISFGVKEEFYSLPQDYTLHGIDLGQQSRKLKGEGLRCPMLYGILSDIIHSKLVMTLKVVTHYIKVTREFWDYQVR